MFSFPQQISERLARTSALLQQSKIRMAALIAPHSAETSSPHTNKGPDSGCIPPKAKTPESFNHLVSWPSLRTGAMLTSSICYMICLKCAVGIPKILHNRSIHITTSYKACLMPLFTSKRY